MKESVLLVSPPFSTYKRYLNAGPQEPLGILFLAGYLRSKGVNVDAVDFLTDKISREGDYYWQGTSEEEVETEFLRRQPKIIAISSMYTIHCEAIHRLASAAKRAVPEALVVVGGTHASAFPKILAADKNIDLVVVGEGEQSLHEIITKTFQGESARDIAGVAYIDDSGVYHCNERRSKFLDLADHPGPARDILDINRYIATSYSRRHAMNPRRLPIMTSRGCPHNCIYCQIHSIWQHTYHKRNPKSVLDEIEQLVTQHQIGEIMFWDDNLAADRRHFTAILDGIIERRLPIRWCTPNGIAIWRLDEALVDKCRESGCYKFTFGLETGSLKTQKFIRKTQLDLNRAKQIIRHCNRIGLWTMSPFIIGFPFETREDIMETINYAVDCGVDVAVFFIATPYPGSDMFEVYRENGLLPDDVECAKPDQWVGSISNATLATCELTAEEVTELWHLAQAKFRAKKLRSFANPLYLMSKMRGWDDIKFVFRFIPQGFNQFILKR